MDFCAAGQRQPAAAAGGQRQPVSLAQASGLAAASGGLRRPRASQRRPASQV
ncbi:MAG TPA: hypothetical protein VFQ44_05110 [Streptosporangiaceae bacterium]|nr:hypothetical protein [Streptosporangiaceae bacterium]